MISALCHGLSTIVGDRSPGFSGDRTCCRARPFAVPLYKSTAFLGKHTAAIIIILILLSYPLDPCLSATTSKLTASRSVPLAHRSSQLGPALCEGMGFHLPLFRSGPVWLLKPCAGSTGSVPFPLSA